MADARGDGEGKDTCRHRCGVWVQRLVQAVARGRYCLRVYILTDPHTPNSVPGAIVILHPWSFDLCPRTDLFLPNQDLMLRLSQTTYSYVDACWFN